MTRIMLIGNGAREHAIAKAVMRSDEMPELYAYMKADNPGIHDLCTEVKIGSYDNLDEIIAFGQNVAADFCIIGPEDPLARGAVDALEEVGIPCVGPSKDLAQLETSKAFTRELMQKYKIPGLPGFRVFHSTAGISEYIQTLPKVVIKPDGLTAGKGVKVQDEHFTTKEEALAYCREVLKSHPAVIIEEKLIGEEFSLQSFTDGSTIVDCPPVQDHKRAYDGDCGPNTGGMGSYSDSDHLLPFLKKEHILAAQDITVKVAKALYKETGKAYKGIMYGGFIVTKMGVKLIEYNARMGDPESMNVLSILESDFVELCRAIISGNLSEYIISFAPQATVCKYIVPKGYPDSPVKGQKIIIPAECEAEIFLGSVEEREDGLYMLGSRAVAFVGKDSTLQKAERKAEEAASKVIGNVFHRTDIGTKSLIDNRIRHVASL